MRHPRRLRTVRTTPRTPKLGPTVLWAYGYADLAALLGTTPNAVRLAVARGRFDPADLASVLAFAVRRGVVRATPGTAQGQTGQG